MHFVDLCACFQFCRCSLRSASRQPRTDLENGLGEPTVQNWEMTFQKIGETCLRLPVCCPDLGRSLLRDVTKVESTTDREERKGALQRHYRWLPPLPSWLRRWQKLGPHESERQPYRLDGAEGCRNGKNPQRHGPNCALNQNGYRLNFWRSVDLKKK